jgi:hypothetical protein
MSVTSAGFALTLPNRSLGVSTLGDCNVASSALPSSLLVDAAALWLGAADVSGDGVLDLVAVSGRGDLLVLVNDRVRRNGSTVQGTFAAFPLVPLTNVTVAAVGDIDGDGGVDVVVGRNGSAGASLLRIASEPSGIVVPNVQLAAAVAIAVFDCDRDGDVDAFVGVADGSLRLLVNTGVGAFADDTAVQRGVNVSAPRVGPGGIAVADIDNDGDVDVLVVSTVNRLFVNNGSCGFVEAALSRGVAEAGLGTRSATFGDVDLDGDVDVWLSSDTAVPNNVLWNVNNTYVRMSNPAIGSARQLSGFPVFVDADGDGDVDVPGVDFTNALNVGNRSLTVRCVGRSGALNQHGVVVCLRLTASAALLGCRVVGGGTGSHYDVHFGLTNASAPVDVEATLVGGHAHSAATQAMLRGVSPVAARGVLGFPFVSLRDVPSILSLSWSDPSAVVGTGRTVRLRVVPRWAESNLAVATAVINGRDVSATFAIVGGVYELQYKVLTGDPSIAVGGVTVAVALRDADFPSAVSDVVTHALLPTNLVAVDTSPPQLLRDAACGPLNGTLSGSVVETLCVSCDSVAAEPLGCTIAYTVNGSAVANVSVNASTGNAAVLRFGPFAHGNVVVVALWAVDRGGNVGDRVVVAWEVDLISPVTQWLPPLPAPLTNSTAAGIGFSCSRTNCRYRYSLDGGALTLLGGALNASHTSTSVDDGVALVDAVVNVTSPLVVTAALPAFTVSLAVRVNGGAALVVPAAGTNASAAALQVRVDGSASAPWIDVHGYNASGASFNATTGAFTLPTAALAEGVHVLDVRGVNGSTPELTPWSHQWVVDRTAPVAAFLQTPPAWSDVPSSNASFLFDFDDEDDVVVQYRLGNASAGGDATFANWTTLRRAAVSLAALRPGTRYVLQVRGVDVGGNVGAAATHAWASQACANLSSVDAGTFALRHRSVDADAGERVFTWQPLSVAVAGFEYRVDGGNTTPWLRTAAPPVLVTGLVRGVQHTVEVRVRVPDACVGVLPQSALPAANALWFEFEASPGRVVFATTPTVSTYLSYGDFDIDVTARGVRLLYSLDGSSWAGCQRRLRVGPLSVGNHNVTVRAVDAAGAWTVGVAGRAAVRLVPPPAGSRGRRALAHRLVGARDDRHGGAPSAYLRLERRHASARDDCGAAFAKRHARVASAAWRGVRRRGGGSGVHGVLALAAAVRTGDVFSQPGAVDSEYDRRRGHRVGGVRGRCRQPRPDAGIGVVGARHCCPKRHCRAAYTRDADPAAEPARREYVIAGGGGHC